MSALSSSRRKRMRAILISRRQKSWLKRSQPKNPSELQFCPQVRFRRIVEAAQNPQPAAKWLPLIPFGLLAQPESEAPAAALDHAVGKDVQWQLLDRSDLRLKRLSASILFTANSSSEP